MAKLIKKLLNIRKGLLGFSKDSKGFNFSYVSGDQVLAKFRELADKEGVMLTFSVTEHKLISDEYTVQTKGEVKRKVDYIIDGTIEFTFWDVDSDETLVTKLPLVGNQTDPSQALGSALTYCERYNIMKQFSVPTDADDPDSRNKPQSNKKKDTTTGDADKNDFHRDDFIQTAKGKKNKWTWKTADADYLVWIAGNCDPGQLVDFANMELHARNQKDVKKTILDTIHEAVATYGDPMREYLVEIGAESPVKLGKMTPEKVNEIAEKVSAKCQELA